ncbi:polyprenyl synthetase family protein [Methanothermobacter thermautotrophicus]|uniref:Polyprenyl synthetase family protein n=1 Tax=Methanothermobacter thermautotrophicus TaxID=145262 RepID=A0A842YIY4_METTF|nr:short chain isoprenyl diphosphate synthase IdsA [Methanothermobacter thermautotrophicus]MBE2899296.1 polyprenyl synthetase family protein [Methanothermobacter thermautotrophicus]
MMEVVDILRKYSEIADERIRESISDITPETLLKASEHLITAGSKKIRPSLALLSAEAVGGEPEDAAGVAAAIELIHTFSLIHDDIMDDDEIRRGEPAVHVLWGEPMAILAGDVLFSKAFEAVIRNGDSERVKDALAVVVDSCVKICEGQALDMGFEERLDVTEDEYMEMIYKKTAALIAAATKAGAIMGGGSPQEISALEDYGRFIGLAFQIHDDYLDVVSDEESLGKPVGSDIAEGKMTLMVVKALERASDEDRERLISILGSGDDKLVAEAIDIFERYGATEYAHGVALDHVRMAKERLEVLEESDAREALAMIADFVLEREH